MFRKQPARNNRAQQLRRPRAAAAVTNHESLTALLEWFLPDEGIFARVKLHGNTSWSPSGLVRLALCWAWSESRNLTDAFTEAVGCCQSMFACSPLTTYQGFLGALTRWTSTFVPLLCVVLQARMQEIGGKFWRVDQWVPIAFDGSRSRFQEQGQRAGFLRHPLWTGEDRSVPPKEVQGDAAKTE